MCISFVNIIRLVRVVLVLFLFSMSLRVFVASAAVSHHFATSARVVYGDVLNIAHLVGGPDGRMVPLNKRGDTVRIRLPEPTDSNLVFWHRLLAVSTAQLRFTFRDERGSVLFETVEQILLGSNHVIVYEGGRPYQFVDFLLESKESIELDAAGAASPIVENGRGNAASLGTAMEAHETLFRGSLITLPDDADEKTQYDQTVYIIGADGMRHAFPSRDVFFSWGFSFDDVRIVSRFTLHAYPLGSNVPVRPGSFLVKAQSVPDVFVVSGVHELRHIPNEEAARRWFGDDWAKRVLDVQDMFFVHYRKAQALNPELASVVIEQPLLPY